MEYHSLSRKEKRDIGIELLRSRALPSWTAKKLGVAHSTVMRWARRERIEVLLEHPYPDHIRQAVLRDVEVNVLSYSEAARRFGISTSTVRGWCKAAGIASTYPRSIRKNVDLAPEGIKRLPGR